MIFFVNIGSLVAIACFNFSTKAELVLLAYKTTTTFKGSRIFSNISNVIILWSPNCFPSGWWSEMLTFRISSKLVLLICLWIFAFSNVCLSKITNVPSEVKSRLKNNRGHLFVQLCRNVLVKKSIKSMDVNSCLRIRSSL